MRIVSLVPSWTETLVWAELEVVGRTRFCIHGGAGIPVIGGTKDWDFAKIQELKPDLIVLDQEENPRFMSEQTKFPWFASHVTSVHSMPEQTANLARRVESQRLASLSSRWEKIVNQRLQGAADWGNLPGVVEWLRPVAEPIDRVLYIIWRNPWMVVSRDTFIGSMLGLFGPLNQVPLWPRKYPEVATEELDQSGTLLLFSSEPFPFHKQKSTLGSFRCASAIVNGESFSWFGLRSLEFLERQVWARG